MALEATSYQSRPQVLASSSTDKQQASSSQQHEPAARQLTAPVWHMKCRSALDKHARFLRYLHLHQKAQQQQNQVSAHSKQTAASQLQNFSKRLRHAVLSNGNVASGWRPAAYALQVTAKLDNKLSGTGRQDSSYPALVAQRSQSDTMQQSLAGSMLADMQQLVDSALSRSATALSSRFASHADHSPAATAQPFPSSSKDAAGAAAAAHSSSTEAQRQASFSADAAQANWKQPANADHGNISTDQQGLLGAPSACHGQSSSRSQGPDSAASSTSIGSKRGKQRPAWALTAGAAQEAEQQEEEDLLAFAGGLEFDKYIGDQEDADLKAVLQGIRSGGDSQTAADKATLRKHVVRAINNLAGKDVKKTVDPGCAADAQSCAQQSGTAASTRSKGTVASKAKDANARAAQLAASPAAAAGAAKWDSSTKAGSDAGVLDSSDADSSSELLRENPDMKKVHSVASAAALLKKANNNHVFR